MPYTRIHDIYSAQQSRRRVGCSEICAACPEPADMDQQYMGHVHGTRALCVARECLVQSCMQLLVSAQPG